MKKGTVNMLIDGQWGSTGKGKVAGYLALRNDIQIAAAVTSPNAGHTFIDGDRHVMMKQLPTGALNQDATVLLTAQCVIDPDRLMQEAEEYGCLDRLVIHPHAAVVTQEHKDREKANLNRISSTLQGTGAALASRIMREPQAVAKNHPVLKMFVHDATSLVHRALAARGTVFLEVSQGFDLSLTQGHQYPYVTSREISTASGLDALGVNHTTIGDVYGSIRTLPIRVGHAFDVEGQKVGDSGPWYDDQEELTWEEVSKASNCPELLTERTTVTNKIRRIFTLSMKQLRKFMGACAPTKLFLNHVNYWDYACYGADRWEDLPESVRWRVRELQTSLHDLSTGMGAMMSYSPQICLLGTGPDDSHMVEID